jgi:hypothetical protein
VGSTPTPATILGIKNVPWSNGRAPGLHPGDGGSIPSGMTRGSFDSMGGWSNGKTPGLQPGDRGSIPRPVHSHLRWKVAGYGSPGLTANECAPDKGMRVRIPRLPLLLVVSCQLSVDANANRITDNRQFFPQMVPVV